MIKGVGKNKCFAICNKRKFLFLMAWLYQGVHLVVHLLDVSVSCLGDGHYGSCYCRCICSTGITEVLELTSSGCRQQMHKWDFVLEALEVVPIFGRNRRVDGVASSLGLCELCPTRMKWLHLIILLMIYSGEKSTCIECATLMYSFQSHPLISDFLFFSFSVAHISAESEMFCT